MRGLLGAMPVGAFFDSIPLHASASSRVLQRPLAGRPAMILAPEDLIVLKPLVYVRSWLVDCVGDDDHRVAEWDAMVRDLGPRP